MLAQNLVPFCLDGMRFVCCTCRIPGKEEDKIKTYDRNKCFHTVVIRLGDNVNLWVLRSYFILTIIIHLFNSFTCVCMCV